MAIFRPIAAKEKQSSVNDEAVRELLRDLEHTMRAQQFNNARATLAAIAGHLKLAIRAHNIRLLNTLTSVEEGIASEDLTLTAAKRELKEAYETYKLEVEKALDSLVIPDQEGEAVALEDVMKRATEVMLSFEKNRAAVRQRIKTSGIVVTTAPVLALSHPQLDVVKLRNNGFKARSLEGYPVLEDQMVVGISVEVVLSRLPNRRLDEDGTPLKPSKSEERDEIKSEFLETVISRFSGRRLIQLGGENSYEGTSWYWLAPSDHVKLFKACTVAPHVVNSLSIKSWGFPFANQ